MKNFDDSNLKEEIIKNLFLKKIKKIDVLNHFSEELLSCYISSIEVLDCCPEEIIFEHDD